jgi:excisionase family DNA binding protein
MLGDREFTTEEIAQICGVSRPAVVDWITRGTLRARLTDGGHRRVARAVLSEFLRLQGYRVPQEVARERPLVFVIDDEALWRTSIETALQNDFDVETFAPGTEVLLAAGERRPDVVLFDLRMPGMDGHQLLDALHHASDDIGDVLIVAIGGHDEDLPAARRGGAHLCLAKARVAAGDLHPMLIKLISEKQRRPMLNA